MSDAPTSNQRPSSSGSSVPAASRLPERFGRYRVVERIGTGGMGAVYLARDESLNRDVAVKTLYGAAASPAFADEYAARFAREAQALAGLSHPNVVRVFDVGHEDGLPYMVMELVPGRSLAARLEAGERLGAAEVRALGIQIAVALAAAHQVGVVHRDVKPANILEAEAGVWKLADFGIARVADSSLTIDGQFLGTPAYAAPESMDGIVSPAGDVYSLAASLYEAAAGEPPFGTGGLMTVLVRAATTEPRSLLGRCPDLAPEADTALRAALTADPQRRPSAAELADRLAGSASARPATAMVAPMPRDPRHAALWLGAALVAIVFIGMIAALASGGDDGGPAARSPAGLPGAIPADRAGAAPGSVSLPAGPFHGAEAPLSADGPPGHRKKRGKHQEKWQDRWWEVREALEQGELHEADKKLRELIREYPDDLDAPAVLEQVRQLRAANPDHDD